MPFAPTPEQAAIFGWFGATARPAPTGTKRVMVTSARAGTGKSTTMIQAMAQSPGGGAWTLFCAFSKRIREELEEKAPRLCRVTTFHAMGYQAIRAAWGLHVDVQEDKGRETARRLCGDLCPQDVVDLVADLASRGKKAGTSALPDLERLAYRFDLLPSEQDEADGHGLDWVVLQARAAMVAALTKSDFVDHDDQLWIPAAGRVPLPLYLDVIVDEAQDMQGAARRMAFMATAPGGRLMFVGDDRQSIFSFAGAEADTMAQLAALPGAATFSLTTTWRCGADIVAVARHWVPDYTSPPGAHRGSVEQGPLAPAPGAYVLSRTNAGAVTACLALWRDGVRATVYGRDVGAGLIKLTRKLSRRCLSMADFDARLTVWTAAEIAEAERTGSATKAERAQDTAAALRAVMDGALMVEELPARIERLFSDDAAAPAAVVCMTAHKAKGLESDAVFILATTFRKPSADAPRSVRVEEENLLYVAVTRARHRLVFVGDLGPFKAAVDAAGVLTAPSEQQEVCDE